MNRSIRGEFEVVHYKSIMPVNSRADNKAGHEALATASSYYQPQPVSPHIVPNKNKVPNRAL